MPLQEPEQIFAEQFAHYAKLREVSDAELQQLVPTLAATPAIVSNWRRGRTATPLAAIPIISKALGMGGEAAGADDPTFILREMGLLGTSRAAEAARMGYNIQRLEMRLRALKNELGQLDRSSGVASITRIARNSAQWSVAMWPVTAGPTSCRMHVEDQVDLRRVDGGATSFSAIFDDPLWHDVLRRTHAVPGQLNSRWSGSDSSVSHWTISHARTPTLPSLRAPYPSVPSVCIYGINIDSGANEVAKLVSVALGYGLTLTRDEAMEQMGIPAWLGATEWEPRARAHQNHLDDPPPAVVWAHHAPPLDGVNTDVFGTTDANVPIFWLRESDSLFRKYCLRWPQASMESLLQFRTELDQLATLNPNITVIDVESTPSADADWKRCLEAAAKVLQHPLLLLAMQQSRAAWPSYQEQDKDIALPFLQWLALRL